MSEAATKPKSVNLFEEHAREVLNAPPEWRVYAWRCLPNGTNTQAFQIDGAVCTAVFKSGKRKGQTNWDKKNLTHEGAAILDKGLHEKWEREWSKRTGLCIRCTGTGEILKTWNHLTGTVMKECPECAGNGLGKETP